MIEQVKGYVREKGGRFHTVLEYYENGIRKRSWKATGLMLPNNKRKAQALLQQRMTEFQSIVDEQNRLEQWGLNPHVQDMLFADLMKEWMERKKRSISPSTLEGYRRILQKADPFFRQRPLKVNQITPAIIENYIQTISSGKQDNL